MSFGGPLALGPGIKKGKVLGSPRMGQFCVPSVPRGYRGLTPPERDPSAGLGLKEPIKGFFGREIPSRTPNLDALGCRNNKGCFGAEFLGWSGARAEPQVPLGGIP